MYVMNIGITIIVNMFFIDAQMKHMYIFIYTMQFVAMEEESIIVCLLLVQLTNF